MPKPGAPSPNFKVQFHSSPDTLVKLAGCHEVGTEDREYSTAATTPPSDLEAVPLTTREDEKVASSVGEAKDTLGGEDAMFREQLPNLMAEWLPLLSIPYLPPPPH